MADKKRQKINRLPGHHPHEPGTRGQVKLKSSERSKQQLDMRKHNRTSLIVMKNEISSTTILRAISARSKNGTVNRTKTSREDKGQQNKKNCLYKAHPLSTGPEWMFNPKE